MVYMNTRRNCTETLEESVNSKTRVSCLSSYKRFDERDLSLKGQTYISHRFRDIYAFNCAQTISFNSKEDFAQNMYGLGRSTSRIIFISAEQYSKYCLDDNLPHDHNLFFHGYSGYKSTTKKVNYFETAILRSEKISVSYLDKDDIKRNMCIRCFIHRKEKI